MTTETDIDATNSDELSTSVARLPNGHFAPGGGGRPKGARNKLTREGIAAIKGLSDAAFAALASNIAAGDQRAVEFVLDRILPKGRVIELDGGSPGDIVEALISAEISPEEAKHIAAAVAKLRELDELDVLKARLFEIESLLKGEPQ